MTFATTYNLWGIAGMVYALTGAALLCNAVFAIPSGFSFAAASADKPLARFDARRLNGQWLDLRIGSALLVIGFFLQMTGAVGTASMNVPAIFVLLALALFAGYYALAKDLIADQLIADCDPAIDAPVLERAASEPAAEAPAAPAIVSPAPAAEPAALPELAPVAIVAQVVEVIEVKHGSAA